MNSQMKKTYLIIVGVAACVAVFLGLVFFMENNPAEIFMKRMTDPKYTKISEQYELTDVNSLIDIHNIEDVWETRNTLRNIVFCTTELTASNDLLEVQTDIDDPDYEEIDSLARIDMLSLGMSYGINSIMYYLHSKGKKNRLAIYHQGHRGDFIHGIHTIKALLDHGYDVIAISMPLMGKNNKPVAHIDGIGAIYLRNHEWMRFLDCPLSFFMSPILAAIEHGMRNKPYSQLSLIGISGGGWAVTLYAALDDRVNNTYQVGGTLPYYLRSPIRNGYKGHEGDFEQSYAPLVKTANYLELYILGSAGEGRKEIQVINQFDNVAAHGIKYRTYESIVSDRVHKLGMGGSFEVVLDTDNSNHSISEKVMEYILNDLEKS